MLRIKVNGAQAILFVRLRLDGGWDLRCHDPVVGEFRFYSGDVLRLWSEEASKWLPVSECDLAELAVGEAGENELIEGAEGAVASKFSRTRRHSNLSIVTLGINVQSGLKLRRYFGRP